MRALNEALEAEERDELPDADEFRNSNAYEQSQLRLNPCLPVYISDVTLGRLTDAYVAWCRGCSQRSRAVPATCSRVFVRSEGSL